VIRQNFDATTGEAGRYENGRLMRELFTPSAPGVIAAGAGYQRIRAS
jgi:hypothetical protein